MVEDELLVALGLEDMLAYFCHQVVATEGRLESALRAARTRSFDLAIIDVNLKGERSFAVADVLMERGIPYIITTGYEPKSLPQKYQSDRVLQKPYGENALQKHDCLRV